MFSLHWHDRPIMQGHSHATNLEALSMQKLWAQEALYGDTCWVASYTQN